jgi:hypothetical protein
MKLQPDDIADIAKLLPVHGMRYVCEWLGTSRKTVRKHAQRLGIHQWPGVKYRRKDSLYRHDIPGVAKACTKCLTVKPLEEFHRLHNGRYGRRPDCKDCHK